MIDFFMNNMNILEVFEKIYENQNCKDILGADLQSLLNEIFTWIQIAVPCIVLVLCSVDMGQAVISQEEKSIKSAQSKCIKRLIIGVAVFFTPTLINILLLIAGAATGTCNIGG